MRSSGLPVYHPAALLGLAILTAEPVIARLWAVAVWIGGEGSDYRVERVGAVVGAIGLTGYLIYTVPTLLGRIYGA